MKKCTYAELKEIFGEHNRNAGAIFPSNMEL